MWAHEVGRGLLLGVGGLALPLMTRGEAPADGAATARDRSVRLLHLVGVVVLISSFWVGYAHSLRWAYVMRAAVVTTVLLAGIELWRPPLAEGWNRRLIWLAAWMLPLGYWLAAAFPPQHKAGLHIVFIGAFALLALAISTQVTLGHGGYRSLMLGKPWQVVAMGGLTASAIVPGY
ncbi:MAG: hypothetical protein ACI8TX_000210 [Hyphomicrobiaceae bacterium]|jgi:uncharacterized protein involved in response to NO